ncbi:MAG: hypothetical protein R3B91_09105 [Planctomycetaceae bacterium]
MAIKTAITMTGREVVILHSRRNNTLAGNDERFGLGGLLGISGGSLKSFGFFGETLGHRVAHEQDSEDSRLEDPKGEVDPP